jgi:glucose-1-phosphatase
MQSVKNIIFDFGGVIINLAPEAVPLAFQKIAGEHFEAIYADFLKLDIFTRIERGDISEDDFLQTITQTGLFTRRQAIDCWNAILLTVPKNRLDLLKRLAKDYNLYLLSNTNGIHVAKFEADMKKMYGIEDFRKNFFVKGYYSHEM